MPHEDSKVVPVMLTTSIIIILWWVSLWLIAEEAIDFMSGDKRHRKMAICFFIIAAIVVYAHYFPLFASRL
jgi:hypothetical protein